MAGRPYSRGIAVRPPQLAASLIQLSEFRPCSGAVAQPGLPVGLGGSEFVILSPGVGAGAHLIPG
jgi:hypothetical protein